MIGDSQKSVEGLALSVKNNLWRLKAFIGSLLGFTNLIPAQALQLFPEFRLRREAAPSVRIKRPSHLDGVKALPIVISKVPLNVTQEGVGSADPLR